MIETARRITGHPIEARIEAARTCDPSLLVARADKARQVLGWQPQYADLEAIVASAWDWHTPT